MPVLISDIHGNLEALEAVMASTGNEQVFCLGDLVCYGPDSNECVRRSANWDVVVAGPMDLAMINHDPNQWNPGLNKHIETTRSRLHGAEDAAFLIETVGSFLPEYSAAGYRFLHGTYKDIGGYIFPEEIYCPDKVEQIVDTDDHVYFLGGSHIPGIFRRDSPRDWQFIQPENGVAYELSRDQKTVVTLGSVGQPRDEDPRAAYAILNDTSIVFYRVEYDVDLTRRKIDRDPDNDNMNGDRLPDGR